MKLEAKKGVVTVNGADRTHKMSMKIDGKVFSLMASGLYKDKIPSIVREIASNAKDSHAQSNNPEPFQIHLPTTIEPWFSVQDFGLGLSYEEMTTVYCVLFESTKDESNDALGAFGLGSKTPFAYSDNFTVTSVKDGLETHYSVFYNDVREPEIAVMNECETDAPNGVTVSIAVQEDDFYTFECAVRDQLHYFTTKPTVVGKNFYWNDANKVEFTLGHVDFTGYGGWGKKIMIIQGEVGYELDMKSMKAMVSEDEMAMLETLEKCHGVIHFPIGKIGVTLSRENVEYEKPTVANIMAEVKVACDGIEGVINSRLEQETTNWDKACLLNQNEMLRGLAVDVDYTVPNLDINRHGASSFSARKIFSTETTLKELDRRGNPKVETTENYMLKKYHVGFNSGRLSAFTSHSRNTIQVNTRVTTIFFRDTDRQPLIRVKNYIEEEGLNDKNVYIISSGIHNIESSEDIFTDSVMQEIADAFGGLNFVKISELDIPVRSGAYRAPSTTARILSVNTAMRNGSWNNPNFARYSTKDWAATTDKLVDMTAGVFIETYSNSTINGTSEMLNKYDEYVKAHVADKPIHAFNGATAKRASKMGTWVTLENYLKEMDAKANKMMVQCKTLARYDKISAYCENYFNKHTMSRLSKYIDLVENKTAVKFIIDAVKAEDKYHKKLNSLNDDLQVFYKNFSTTILNKFSNELESHKDFVSLSKASDDFQLLQYVPKRDTSDGTILHIIQYVNCMGEGA